MSLNFYDHGTADIKVSEDGRPGGGLMISALSRSFRRHVLEFFNWLLSCVAVFILVPRADAQFNVYHPFPNSGAVWGMSTVCLDNMCGDWAYIQNYMAGDTMINGLNYMKIQENYLSMPGSGCCFPPGDDGPGYLREDTAARKVYWLSMQSGVENLLYDFTLVVGATLEGFLADNGPGGTGMVVSVDSILIGLNYRKRINIDTTEFCIAFSIIEGIGSTTGLTADFYGPGEMGTGLRCFTLDGNVLYTAPCGPPDLVPCGELPITVEDAPAPIELTVRISPNPSAGLFILNLQQPKHIVVYDAFGREVLQTFGTSVDLSDEPEGMYVAFFHSSTFGSSPHVVRLIVAR